MPPKTMISSPLHAPPWLHLLSFTPSIMPMCFWLVVACVISWHSHLKPWHILLLYFLHCSICCPAQRDNTFNTLRPSHAPPPSSRPLFLPTRVDCCFFWPNGGHLRPTPPSISLFFDVSCFVAPNKGTSRCKHETSAGHLEWTHREQRRYDLGVPLPYPWRERAKPLEGWVAAAHVDCCVLCCVVWCGSEFSYHTGSTRILAKSKWPTFAYSFHKIGHQTLQI